MLGWGLESGHLTEIVAIGVKVRKPKQTMNRELGYTDAEAVAVLRAPRGFRPAEAKNRANLEGEPITRAK